MENMQNETQITGIAHRFGKSVRAIRRAMDMTQAELAAKSGMNKTYLVRVESGDRNITFKTAERIARALEMDVITLIKGVEVELTA